METEKCKTCGLMMHYRTETMENGIGEPERRLGAEKRGRWIAERALQALDSWCPWPETIWTGTSEEYIKAVPDNGLRTAISGYLMRVGWQFAMERVREARVEAEADWEEEHDGKHRCEKCGLLLGYSTPDESRCPGPDGFRCVRRQLAAVTAERDAWEKMARILARWRAGSGAETILAWAREKVEKELRGG